jgi:hypothetical protein
MISNGDSFTLLSNYVRSVNIVINQNYTYQVVVDTNGGYAHASLTYTANTGLWTMASNTPNEWQLAQGNGVVTLACLLENVNAATYLPEYHAEVPASEAAK